jgi:hypothetical protein
MVWIPHIGEICQNLYHKNAWKREGNLSRMERNAVKTFCNEGRCSIRA